MELLVSLDGRTDDQLFSSGMPQISAGAPDVQQGATMGTTLCVSKDGQLCRNWHC